MAVMRFSGKILEWTVVITAVITPGTSPGDQATSA